MTGRSRRLTDPPKMLGNFADLLSGRRTILLVLCIMFTALLGTGLSGHNLLGFYFFFVLGNLGSPGTWPGLAKIIGNWWEPEDHGWIWGIMSTSTNIGGLLVGLLLSGVLQYLDWRSCFFASASVTLLLSTFIVLFLHNSFGDIPLGFLRCCTKEDLEGNKAGNQFEKVKLEVLSHSTEPSEAEIVEISAVPESHPLNNKSKLEVAIYFISSGSLWAVTFATLCVTSVGSFIINFIPLFLSDHLHATDSEAALASIFPRLGMLLGTVLGMTNLALPKPTCAGIFYYSKLSPKEELFLHVGSLSLSLTSIAMICYIDSTSIALTHFFVLLMSFGMTFTWFFPSNIFAIKFGGPNQSTNDPNVSPNSSRWYYIWDHRRL